ncbi:MAG: acyltransferase [Chitinophagaceae bacterium]|nr:acyltransferase [Chitinophagaceae bacterium]
MVQHFYGSFVNVSVLWTSIDLLFALSGLLITGILIETKEDPRYFKKFYMRRILRIFPLYYLLIFLFTVYIFFITSNPQYYSYFKSNFLYFLTYTQNWYFINAGLPPAGHLNHTWSLAIDEQIYLVWPLLVWFCRNSRQLIILCISTLLFSLLYRIGYNIHIDNVGSLHPFPYFHNTFCRLDAFAAGGLLYCLLRFKYKWLTNKKVLIIFFISSLLFIVCGTADNSFERAGYYMRNFGCTLAGINFATWLYFGVKKNNKLLNYIFSNQWLVYTGKISYSLYVFHWFLLILLVSRIENLFASISGIKGQVSLFAAYVICFLLTFLISILSYEYFEKPIIKIKKRFSYK